MQNDTYNTHQNIFLWKGQRETGLRMGLKGRITTVIQTREEPFVNDDNAT